MSCNLKLSLFLCNTNIFTLIITRINKDLLPPLHPPSPLFVQGMRARFLGAVRGGELRKLNLGLEGTKITTAASMRELWGAVWQGNAATLEELEIFNYTVYRVITGAIPPP